jgi:AcrR family transcriptional regulator
MSQSDNSSKKMSARRRARAGRAERLARKTNESGNLTKADWLDAALEVLNQGGIEAVKVLSLSKRLGVTRGSFYWHFADRDELSFEMLEYWEHQLTDSVIKQAKAMASTPEERVRNVLTNVLINRQDRYDIAIAAWAMFDSRAAKFYSRVVRKRLRFFKSLMLDAALPAEEADFRARILLGFGLSYSLEKPRASRAERLNDVDRCVQLAFA